MKRLFLTDYLILGIFIIILIFTVSYFDTYKSIRSMFILYEVDDFVNLFSQKYNNKDVRYIYHSMTHKRYREKTKWESFEKYLMNEYQKLGEIKKIKKVDWKITEEKEQIVVSISYKTIRNQLASFDQFLLLKIDKSWHILKYNYFVLQSFEPKESANIIREYYEGEKIKSEGYYRDKMKNGIFVEYFQNGRLKQQSYYRNNRKQGLSITYFEDGGIHHETNYLNGFQHGQNKEFYQNGNLKMIKVYEKNEPEGPYREYYKNGNLKSEGFYSAGKKENFYKEYYETGELLSSGTYKKDKRNGCFEVYKLDGSLKAKHCYKNGSESPIIVDYFQPE